jgi:uncharacterized protein YutE (UPF0331/DUF86 family)
MFLEDVAKGVESAFQAVLKANTAITSGTFTVSRDNVLAAARIVENQADALMDLWQINVQDLRIDPPGTDDVSVAMAAAWNDRLVSDEDSYKNRVKDYVVGLKKLAVQLGDTAKAYGFSEDEITAAYGRTAGA